MSALHISRVQKQNRFERITSELLLIGITSMYLYDLGLQTVFLKNNQTNIHIYITHKLTYLPIIYTICVHFYFDYVPMYTKTLLVF